MVSPRIADEFLAVLKKSGLLSAVQIESAIESYDLDKLANGTEVAHTLLRRGLITRFQADEMLCGRSRGFFVDNYLLQEILGTGGMGRVYLAQDTNTGKQYALKMLPQTMQTEPGLVARFKQEARAGKKLRHPNIVRTHAIGRTDGVYSDVYYVVMEFIKAVSLEELISLRLFLPWPQACDICCQAATGLQYAHKAGLIHRDVKPANLLIDQEGLVKILDFGLSLIHEDEDEFSLAMIFGQDCLGTADFIAPEQSLDSLKADARCDVYSLGCTLYMTLTGTVPYPCKKITDKLNAHRSKKPRPVRERKPDVPEELAAVIEKMMARNPQKRYQTTAEVCDALKPFAEREAVPFDFQTILSLRAAEAKQRTLATQKQRQAPGSSGSSSRDSRKSDVPSRKPHSKIETKFRGDTQV